MRVRFRLDIDDAIVEVSNPDGFWEWFFTFPDGSRAGPGDFDCARTERRAKEDAYIQYKYNTNKSTDAGKARWKEEKE